MNNNKVLSTLLKRFYWDLRDRNERKYFTYWLISGVPGLFGNMLRGRFVSRHCKSAGTNLSVFAGTRFRSIENMVVGGNVEIGYDNFIQALGGVTIGDDVMMGPGVKIWSTNHRFQYRCRLIREQDYTKEPVFIGNDVWISSNVFICPGVHLPSGAVVAAGSVVGVKKYPPYAIIAGNPARVIGFREDAKSREFDQDVQSATKLKAGEEVD